MNTIEDIPTVTRINPWGWQHNLGFSQGIVTTLPSSRQWLICAGQGAIDADGIPLHPGDMRSQLASALDNLETVLAAAGFTLTDVVRLNIFTTDVPALFAEYDVYTARLAAARVQPASTLLGVNALALPGMMIELEATAAR